MLGRLVSPARLRPARAAGRRQRQGQQRRRPGQRAHLCPPAGRARSSAYGAWIEAVRGGPDLRHQRPAAVADGRRPGPGHGAAPPPAGKPVRVCASRRTGRRRSISWKCWSTATVVVGQDRLGQSPGRPPSKPKSPLPDSGWLAARCWRRERLADGQCVYAHTSPVYVEVRGPAAAARLRRPSPRCWRCWSRRWTGWRSAARCPTEQQRAHLAGVLAGGAAGVAAPPGRRSDWGADVLPRRSCSCSSRSSWSPAGRSATTCSRPDYTLFDALYMTVITLTTVGYGEVHPLSTARPGIHDRPAAGRRLHALLRGHGDGPRGRQRRGAGNCWGGSAWSAAWRA